MPEKAAIWTVASRHVIYTSTPRNDQILYLCQVYRGLFWKAVHRSCLLCSIEFLSCSELSMAHWLLSSSGEWVHAKASVSESAATESSPAAQTKELRLVFGTRVIPHPEKVKLTFTYFPATPLWTAPVNGNALQDHLLHIMSGWTVRHTISPTLAGVLWGRGCLFRQRCWRRCNGCC